MNDNFWKGVFAPTLRKHRLYTGDIENHIELVSWDMEGNVLVADMGFKDGTGVVYHYEIEVEWDEAREMDESRAKEILYHETHGGKSL